MTDPIETAAIAFPARPDQASVTSLGDRVDCQTALGLLVLCRQDLAAILTAVPPSKRGLRLTRALNSLDQRIKLGEELLEARRNG